MRQLCGFGRWAAAIVGSMVLTVAASLALGTPAHAVPASEAPVYAIDDYPYQKAPALMRWRSVLGREAHLMQRAKPEDCKDGQPRLACAAKEALLLEEKLQDKSPSEQVTAVYAYFNAVKYKEHPADCGIDCWKSRLEFLAHREGDCGDHALAEYFTLKRLGFKERDLQLIVAQLPGFEDSFKGGHVVLRVRADHEYYILDNRRTDLADLSGLRKYKVLAGLNAESVQIYNLISDTPPPGAVADAGRYITSPGATPEATETQVAEASTAAQAAAPTPSFVTQSAPTLVAAKSTEEDVAEVCTQSASLADWNPFLPCTPQKQFKIVVKAKTIIGATPNEPVQVAEVPKTETPKVEVQKPEAAAAATTTTEVAKAEMPDAKFVKPDAAALVALPKSAAKPAPAEAPKEDVADDSGTCMQGASLADWNPNLPCTPGGNASSLRIESKDSL